jgi:hypothetical protein
MGLGQTRLSCHSSEVYWILRVHQLLDQCLGLGVIRVVLNDDQCGLHYTVSASTLSYSSCDPRNRISSTSLSMPSDHATAVKLELDKTFQPFPAELGDELYPNGIFEFNITRILAFVATHVDRFPIERVEVDDIANYGSENLDEDAIGTADLFRPILLAEISPGLADQAYVGTCRWQRHGDLQPIRLREGDARGVRALGHGPDCWRVDAASIWPEPEMIRYVIVDPTQAA